MRVVADICLKRISVDVGIRGLRRFHASAEEDESLFDLKSKRIHQRSPFQFSGTDAAGSQGVSAAR
jgi:hypothetical protein